MAFYPNFTALHLEELFGNSEPEAAATSRIAAWLVAGERVCQDLSWYSASAVGNPYHDVRTFPTGRQADDTALGCVTERIVKKIEDNLANAQRIALQWWTPWLDVE